MRLIRFDYALHRGLRVPIIPVLIQWDNKWFKVWAYVDSGAAYSIFSNDVAAQIGINTLPERRLMVVVADGSYIPVSFYTLKLKIGAAMLMRRSSKPKRNCLQGSSLFPQSQKVFQGNIHLDISSVLNGLFPPLFP